MSVHTVFVNMATGRQGGALVRQLCALGWSVRATVRDLESPNAQSLRGLGVHLIRGHWEDDEALRNAMKGCTKMFIGFTIDFRDLDAGPRLAANMVKIARQAGVKQAIVSTTLGVASLEPGNETEYPPTGMFKEYLEKSRRLELVVEEGGFDCWTVIRPAFFMSNFLNPQFAKALQSESWATVMTPEATLQLADHETIGKAACLAFQNPEKFRGLRLGLINEKLPVQAILDKLAAALGDERQFKAHHMSDEEIQSALETGNVPPMSSQRCMRDMGKSVNISELADLVSGLTDFDEFLKRERDLVLAAYKS